MPHRPGIPPPPQLSGDVQVPHGIDPPQPSLAEPQLNPCSAQVKGVQAALQVPETQISPLAQVPHCITFPQPSEAVPHDSPCWLQLVGPERHCCEACTAQPPVPP